MKSFFSVIKGLFFGQNNMSILEEEQIQSPIRTIIKNFLENKIALTGFIVFIAVFLACLIYPIFVPLDTSYQDVTQQNVRPGFTMSAVPKELKNNAKAIDVGATFALGLDRNGRLYIWGQTDQRLSTLPDVGKVEKIAAGLNHALALTEDGQVVTWGLNRFNLDKIPPNVANSRNIIQIEAGNQISMAVDADGKVYFWGNSNLIDFSIGSHQGNIKKVVSTASTVMGLTKDGKVVHLGNKQSPYDRVPENMGNVVELDATDQAALALNDKGELFVWGNDNFDILNIPEDVQGRTVEIAAGRTHFVVKTDDGKLHSWGRNNFFQSNIPIGLGSDTDKFFAGYYQNYAIDKNGKVTHWGLSGYLFGTDSFGRDVFQRIMTGGRLTMTIGAVSVIIAVIIGVIIGGISGYFGGVVDTLLMRFAEIVGALPFLPLAMILSAIIGNKISEVGRIFMVMVILGVLTWPSLARLVRAQILAEREKEFVTAAKAMGIGEFKIIFRHIVPNVITVVIVYATISFAYSLLTESTLSFLGFGVVEPSPTWGNMLTGSQNSAVIANYWWRWVFPSIFLSAVTISINLIGDGLRDAIDPKSNER